MDVVKRVIFNHMYVYTKKTFLTWSGWGFSGMTVAPSKEHERAELFAQY